MRTSKSFWLIAVVIGGFIGCECSAFSEEIRKFTLSNGTIVDYALVLPEQFDWNDSYPALLAFPGGSQTMGMVRAALERYWGPEGGRRGFIVISPAAPNGVSFVDGSEKLIPEFLRHLLSEFRIQSGKFHVVGNSNGGKSAFRAAILYPDLFRSVTVLAGFPPKEQDMRELRRLKGMRINMFVGESDPVWLAPMLEAKARLEVLGIDLFFQSFPRNGHFLPDLSFGYSGRIFDRIAQRSLIAPSSFP